VIEALANGIACQQVTLTLGIRLLNRLSDALLQLPVHHAAHPHQAVSAKG
jgi:hypothetical protein